ncbi:FadR/GntR family transcriptional regulator [Megasphaera paucivorans]|uniref:DNA-binding transcriptional regulator, FadR family n=1 Tax=Megasphaera paucivorans TaxID=349095 RepID=A0A1G9R998_9FIRM|nr:FadR/GntR family transcriptional regulator [Megasphaera paucivorans]SDM19005.1 DNA-binding transcriptional regulator, FadR family [Megasphaera paucivorans]
MMPDNRILAQSIADDIMAMITIQKRFKVGDKLPNENDFSKELNVSRNTLREAIRILNTYGILEIHRGKGTFVTAAALKGKMNAELDPVSFAKIDIKDLYEIRLILEPSAAYLAAKRGTDAEISRIVKLGKVIEEKIYKHEDRTKEEHAFHTAIAQATHNKFMNNMIPILHEAILKGVVLSHIHGRVAEETVADHFMVTDFLSQRNAEGARDAMRIHILHAIRSMEIQ